MKKLLMIIVMLLGMSTQLLYAAGTCVLDASDSSPSGQSRWTSYICTGAAIGGLFDPVTITGFKGYFLYSVETWPGTTPPTDASDFTLLDSVTGEDMMGTNGTNAIDSTTPVSVLPKSTVAAVNFYHLIKGNLSLVITGNTDNGGIIHIGITGVR